MSDIKQGVILCGGLGTRLGKITKQLPKPMVDVSGKPFLEHLLIQLKKNGIKKVLLLVGYRSEVIKKYFGDGKKLNLKISYSFLPKEYGTGSRIFKARNILDKKFILLYSDNYSSLNISKLNKKFCESKQKILFSLVKKKNGNCNFDIKKDLVKYQNKRSKINKYVEIGYMIISKKVLEKLRRNDTDFSKFLVKMSKLKLTAGIVNHHGYTSVGDLKRLKSTRRLFSNNNYFLVDRDGVLNVSPKKRYVTDSSELKINKKLCSKLPKNSNLLCITNQAGLSTKEVSLQNLKKINKLIKNYLKQKKIFIKEFFISHHHYNSNSFYRKPNPGLFFEASQKYNFILDKTFYIGDDKRDIEAAYNANTYIIYVGKKLLTKSEKVKYKFTILNKKILNLYNEKIRFNF